MRPVKLPEDRPALMAILNVTPDSFSDGGLYFDGEAAFAAGMRMIEEGADLVDIGGESTRPGSQGVSADEEMRRVLPVVAALAKEGVAVSIDTSKAEVAQAALDVGAIVVNDVTALGDPRMASVCAKEGATVCLMHMKGSPRTMQQNPEYTNVVRDVSSFLEERASAAIDAGIARQRIWVDPGIGFGKAFEHNLALLKNLDAILALGYPVLVGVSRKSFIGNLLGGDAGPLPASERLEGTLAAQVVVQCKGARIIRAHDVRAARRAIEMAAAILS